MKFLKTITRLIFGNRWTSFQSFWTAGWALVICLVLGIVSQFWNETSQRSIVLVVIVVLTFLAGIQFEIGVELRRYERKRSEPPVAEQVPTPSRHGYDSRLNLYVVEHNGSWVHSVDGNEWHRPLKIITRTDSND